MRFLIVGGLVGAAIAAYYWARHIEEESSGRRRLKELAHLAYLRNEMDKYPDKKGEMWAPGE